MTRSPRLLLSTAVAALATAALAAPAGATPVPVHGGSVAWGLANHYSVSVPAINRGTWLGHATNPGQANRGQSNGTATASDGATVTAPDGTAGTVVGPESIRGTDQLFTFNYGTATGTYDADAKTADVSSTGAVTFVTYPGLPTPPAPLTVSNPRIVLTGTTGAVYAGVDGASAGQGGAVTPYDPTTPLFTIDASAATYVTQADGSVLVTGLIPTLAKGPVFGSTTSYKPGESGPDRTPNTWGGFGLLLQLTKPAVATPQLAAAPTAAPQLVTVKHVTRKAFRASKGTVKVKIRKRGEWTILGEGTVKGKQLTLTLAEGTTLKGDYVLRRISQSSRLPKSVVVTIKTGK